MEELGSGYFDLQAASGSGGSEEEDPDATFLDDEDLQSQTVQIDVKCQMSKNTESQVNNLPEQSLENVTSSFLALLFYELNKCKQFMVHSLDSLYIVVFCCALRDGVEWGFV